MEQSMVCDGTVANWRPMPRYLLRKDMVRRELSKIPHAGCRCLEFGYGAGDMLVTLAELGFEAHGYDFSQHSYATAKDRVDQTPHKESVVIHHPDKFPDAAGTYDFVFAFEVLEHIEEDVDVLKQWYKLLKPGGTLMISVPAHMRKWNFNDKVAGHVRRYERDELKTKFSQAGFDTRYVYTYGYPMTLALDGLNSYSDKKKAEKNALAVKRDNYEELSKTSFAQQESKLVDVSAMLSNDLLMTPFYWLQQVFRKTDLGSGYLAAATKV